MRFSTTIKGQTNYNIHCYLLIDTSRDHVIIIIITHKRVRLLQSLLYRKTFLDPVYICQVHITKGQINGIICLAGQNMSSHCKR